MNHLWTPWRMPYLRGETSRPTDCVFCQKVDASDDHEHVIFRSEFVFATLNLYPYNSGHLLIVPYRHVADFSVLPLPVLTDLMRTAQEGVEALRAVYHPEAFNLGMNLGPAAGAGIAAHLHMHIVPRWSGDTNYMTVIGQTRIIPDLLDDTYHQLVEAWPKREA